MTHSVSRRELLTLAAAGVGGLSCSGWLSPLAAYAAAGGKPHKSCILLWMDGGPSHLDTFDPKPDASVGTRGEFNSIATSVPGVRVTEMFPTLAGQMKEMAFLRGMSTEEPDHSRGRIYMHTGYRPGLGGVEYPGLGSIVSAELGNNESALPNFVVTGTPLNKYTFVSNPGYLGPRHQPLSLNDPERGLENLRPLVAASEFDDRLSVLEKMESGFARTYRSPQAEAHRTMIARAARLIRSEKANAFDLGQEPANVRDAYGDSVFGRGCLLARRLIESGVSFVEVYSANWDTHEKAYAAPAKAMMTAVDRGMGTLIRELKERGLLESTLIVWMGEFGRTPNVNRNAGRDHYARAWTTALAGGGVRGGSVHGKTDATGANVVDGRVSASDFMATICKALGIDYTKTTQTAGGRPIRLVEKEGKPVVNVLGGSADH